MFWKMTKFLTYLFIVSKIVKLYKLFCCNNSNSINSKAFKGNTEIRYLFYVMQSWIFHSNLSVIYKVRLYLIHFSFISSFSENTYEFSVPEDAQPGTVIGQIQVYLVYYIYTQKIGGHIDWWLKIKIDKWFFNVCRLANTAPSPHPTQNTRNL